MASSEARMTRRVRSHLLAAAAIVLSRHWHRGGCSTRRRPPRIRGQGAEPLAIATAAVESRSIDRFLRVTGSLTADAQAEVSAETGRARRSKRRSNAAPASPQGALLVRISPSETVGAAPGGRRERRADRSAARAHRRRSRSIARRVPDVMNAKASLDLAEAEFNRMRIAARPEGRSRRASSTSAGRSSRRRARSIRRRRTSPISRIARSRARAPGSRWPARPSPTRPCARRSTGLVAERLVSVGDYVTRGARVATVVRVDPLRVELTVPEQHVSLVQRGSAGAADGRRLPRPGVRGDSAVRLAVAALRSARAHGRSDRRERRRPTQAGLLRDRARSPARRGAGTARARDGGRNHRRHEPRLRRSKTTRSRSASSRSARSSTDRSKSRLASSRATSSQPNRRAVSRMACRSRRGKRATLSSRCCWQSSENKSCSGSLPFPFVVRCLRRSSRSR